MAYADGNMHRVAAILIVVILVGLVVAYAAYGFTHDGWGLPTLISHHCSGVHITFADCGRSTART